MSSSSAKKNSVKDSIAATQGEDSSSAAGVGNQQLNTSGSSNSSSKSRKRKHCEIVRFSDLESEFEDCDLEDAAALETKLRKVARKNSLSHDEMMKLLHKFVKNEHILALVTLKAEDELAREKREDEQRAIIITETPSVAKLTRAKARELNKTPFPNLKNQEQSEIASLIKDDLHSDEEDEEYVFQEEDFVSDDDPNNTASDLESNPRTPQTPIPTTEAEDSPIKLTEDGCFKVPLIKKSKEDFSEELRIATRTRSKLCLQQTTIEDLQSEFVPPDLEDQVESTNLYPLDEDWMQFLNDFTKPLNNSLVGDDDDPINDPEYIAEKVTETIFNRSNYYQDYKDDEQSDVSLLNDSAGGELTIIKTLEGGSISVYLRMGNRLLFCSGKFFYIEHTTAQTDHQKEYTGIVSTCHTCGVKIKGSLKVSSNFICHLKARHPEVYQEFLKLKQEAAGSNARVKKADRPYGGFRTSPYPTNPNLLSNILQNQEKQEQFQSNLLQFIVATNQPLKVVENSNFMKLFEHVDFPLQLKTADCYEKLIKEACDYKKLEFNNFFSNSGVYVCITTDVWSYGECKYLAIACHWIDDQYQRQSALLSCKRSTNEDLQTLKTIQIDVLMHYGFKTENIVNNITTNIQNFEKDFLEFGITKEVLCMDSPLESMVEDCSFLKLNQENLKILDLNNNDHIMKFQQLDILKLNKIWGLEFNKHLTEDLKFIHKSCIDKCCKLWLESDSKEFKESFKSILNAAIIKPNIFSLPSLYLSLKQLIYNKEKLSHLCRSLNKPCFTSLELEYLEELVDVFEPLNAAFEFLDMPQNHYYGCFLPTLVTLKWKLTRLINSKKLKHLPDILNQLKEELLKEFKPYYDLNDSKSEAILAAITYPPVKTRFLMGLQDTVSCFNFQPRNLLLKYGKEHHINADIQNDTKTFLQSHHTQLDSIATATDFFDFGDTTENVDAEELRDVNISKKELNDLVAELFEGFEGLINEGTYMESIELETPRKFISNHQEFNNRLDTTQISNERLEQPVIEAAKQLEFVTEKPEEKAQSTNITSTNLTQHDYSFHPNVMSTPSTNNNPNLSLHNPDFDMTLIPVAFSNNNLENSPCKTVTIPSSSLNTQLEIIAVPIPGQPNCFQLAKIVNSTDNKFINSTQLSTELTTSQEPTSSSTTQDTRYSVPYETNYTCEYVSVRRHIMAEYIDKFENLKHAQDNQISSTTTDLEYQNGFTHEQYQLMQQQLRIHVQTLTQTFVQTYCHPEFWKIAHKPRDMLSELQIKSKDNGNFKIWNLDMAVDLIHKWQQELDEDTEENKEMMNFIHKEIDATNRNTRQIPRFHPRIMDCYLDSPVFMYPEYLPRMPFSPKTLPYEVFSPAESYLIAMGLEKHLKIIYEKKERVPNKSTPVRMACKRLCKDTLSGKFFRRVWDHILHLQKVDYYNPIKYFFEHNKAPPVEHEPIIGFENNTALPLKDRIPELPLVYQTYLEMKNKPPEPPKVKNSHRRSSASSTKLKASEEFRNSYLEFVREAVGEDITLPENLEAASQPDASNTPNLNSENNFIDETSTKRRKSTNQRPPAKRRPPQSLTINVNYVFGASINTSNVTTTSTPAILPALTNSSLPSSQLTNPPLEETALENLSLTDSSLNHTYNHSSHLNFANDTPVINYNFDLKTQTLQPAFEVSQLCSSIPETDATQTKITDFYEFKDTSNINLSHWLDIKKEKHLSIKKRLRKIFKKPLRISFASSIKLNRKIYQKAKAYREKRSLQKRCEDLITAYCLHLETLQLQYKHNPLIHYYYRHFKALELYTNLLIGLKTICNKTSSLSSSLAKTTLNKMSNSNSPSSLKRSRNSNSHTEDDSSPSAVRQVRKLNRQEENFRHMLLPDTPEEANRKDAIYAFNFYDKVEEAFKASNRIEECKKFNAILKSFDPKKDKVSDLYYKLEKLFLPDHPELAQVFLTFLLPSEAAEIGKFFEYFMINNMTTFINKLNIYFNKQPAQIRKIYNCLNDLAEDPDVSMKKVETKIVPLLKGNQFLIDWFMQQFPQATPPERLFSNPEHIINLKEQQSNRTGEYIETITDLLDSPTNDPQQQTCQLRYINGRIFYGSKMLLPAKLSFMAASCKDKNISASSSSSNCVHGIKDHGEKRLQAAADLISSNTNTTEPATSDDQDKSEEEDVSKALIIDTTAEEDDSCSSLEVCDDATLKAHALRLNPSYYGSTCYAANNTSTPNLTNNFQLHHPNAKKTSLNFNDEAKISPRKNSSSSLTSSSSTTQQQILSSPSSTLCQSPLNSREKRKSPSKKTKSPLNTNRTSRITNNQQPMVVIHETNSAIQCAKRLKSLIEGDEHQQQLETQEETIDTKEHINIVARTKSSMKSNINQSTAMAKDVKEENTDELEFLPENSSITPSPFPCLHMDTDSNEEDVVSSTTPPPPASTTPSQNRVESDEDCKLDIVASLTTTSSSSTTPTVSTQPLEQAPTTSTQLNTAWTRDEDKVILIEMKLGSQNRQELYQRIVQKLPQRSLGEITARHQFLMDFLSKLQGK